MIILGHRDLGFAPLYSVAHVDAIKQTPSHAMLLLQRDAQVTLLAYVREQQLSFALYATTVTELVLAQNYGATFILIEPELAEAAHRIATNYLFDAKILCHINDESQIETLALLGIDGVYLDAALISV